MKRNNKDISSLVKMLLTLEAKQKLFSMAETEEIATTEMEVFSQTGAEIEVQ